MTDISVIILVGKEELHIKRCLENLAPLAPRQVFVVESQKGDRTHEIAIEVARQLQWQVKVRGEGEQRNGSGSPVDAGPCPRPQQDQPSTVHLLSRPTLSLVWHDWPGNQAAQFNWALDNLPIEGEWVLRLDADEYLTDELIAEIKVKLPQMDSVSGIVLRRRHIWKGVWVRRGMYPTRILRLFRRGHGRSDGKLMDEHIIVDGAVVEFEHDFVDHSLVSVGEWEEKHRGYAKREAQSFLSGERSHGAKAVLKWCYYRLLPSFARPAIYWFKRAIVSGAYFESPEARDFTNRHAYWYRTQVEREIRALKKKSWNDFIQSDMEAESQIQHAPN